VSKANDLMAKYGGNIAQTVGIRPGLAPQGVTPEAPPDKYAGAVKSRTFGEMPVESIEAGPQPRTEFDDQELARLAESIKRYGQLAPIRIRHDEARGRWVVLVGERRLRACRLAGLPRVRVEFVERAMTEADILAEQVVENAVRADLKPVEQTRAYRRLMEMNGWTAQQLAETLDVEPTLVYRSLGLERLAGDVAERVDEGAIRATAAYEISKLQFADDQRAVAEKVVAEGLDHAGTVAEVKRIKAEREGKSRAGLKGRAAIRARPRTSRTLKAAGCRITVENRRGVDDALLLAALEEAAGQLRASGAGDHAAA